MKKNVRHLKSGGVRQDLRSYRLSMGVHAVREVLKIRPKSIMQFYIKKDWQDSQEHGEIVRILRSKSISFEEKNLDFFDKFGSTHQGLACYIKDSPEFDLEKVLALDSGLVLMLDGVEDPHNLGAILRTAWLMEVAVVIVPKDRAVGLTPTVHKVSCGAVEHVPVLFTSNFQSIALKLKEGGFWIYGLSGEASTDIYSLKLSGKIVWVLGAEDKGMRTTTQKICDELVRIPQCDNAASYNVSVSAAIAISETLRQIRK